MKKYEDDPLLLKGIINSIVDVHINDPQVLRDIINFILNSYVSENILYKELYPSLLGKTWEEWKLETELRQ